MDNKNNQNQMQFNLHPDVAVGVYSNLALIAHSKNDFILDFAVNLPGMPKPDVVTRVICSPENTKRLLAALQENIARYEQQFGVININQRDEKIINPFGPKELS